MKATQRKCCVEGLNLERFLKRASECGVSFRRISRDSPRKMTLLADDDAMPVIHSIAQKGGWTLTELGVRGIGQAEDLLRRRRTVAICLLITAALYICASQCILRIDAASAGRYLPDVTAYLAEIGVSVPMSKADCDLVRIREALSWRYPDVQYIECAYRGVTLVIRFHQGQTGGTVGKSSVGNMVAARDGIITSVVTTSGTAVVAAGDVVHRGDVLIVGEEKGRGGTVSAVSASGSVLARVWEEAHVSMPLNALQTEYTGRTETVLDVTTPWFKLWRTKNPSYSQYDTSTTTVALGGLFFPLQVQKSVRKEFTLTVSDCETDSIIRQAKEAALGRLLEANGFADDFVDKWVEYSMIEDEVVCASAYGERIVDIAVAGAD